MRRLVALMISAVSLVAAAQFPNLPYNPDENGDGLIGVVDLQGLLAEYGSEFSAATLPIDSSFAVLGVGSKKYLECVFECSSLPGKWAIVGLEEAGFLLSQENINSNSWLRSDERIRSTSAIAFYVTAEGEIKTYGGDGTTYDLQCYCTSKQLPRVEYSYCRDNWGGSFQDCVDQRMEEGWYPLGGISGHSGINSSSNAHQFIQQAFWRWAE